jgi:hypothetical protein
MALLWCEGFDGISSSTNAASNTETEAYLNMHYSAVTSSGAGAELFDGWHGGKCLSLGPDSSASNNYIRKTVTESTTLIFGLAISNGEWGGSSSASILNDKFATVRHAGDGVEHLIFSVQDHRHIRVTRGSTFLGIAYNVFRPGSFYYFEAKVTIHNSTGSVVLRSNGQQVLNLTNIDTKNGGTADAADTVEIRGIDGETSIDRGNTLFDDWYIADGTGSNNNDFIGPLKIETLLPDGVGNASDLTPLSGTNFSNVDEIEIDDDTTYVSSATITDKDTHTMSALTDIDGSIFGMTISSICRVEDVTTHGLTNVVRRSTSESSGANPTVSSTSYVVVSDIFEQDPAAGPGAWTVTNVNAMEAGYEVG